MLRLAIILICTSLPQSLNCLFVAVVLSGSRIQTNDQAEKHQQCFNAAAKAPTKTRGFCSSHIKNGSEEVKEKKDEKKEQV